MLFVPFLPLSLALGPSALPLLDLSEDSPDFVGFAAGFSPGFLAGAMDRWCFLEVGMLHTDGEMHVLAVEK